jgi:succinyl-diaminopimelate desuccinylase
LFDLSLRELAQAHQSDLIDFAQRVVQTPSPPGHEAEVAELIKTQMGQLDFDEVTTDEVGNVVGRVRGDQGPVLMFNGHMDHVDPGDPAGWSYAPHSGAVVEGELWGRGSVDMKGPLAAMVCAAGLVKQHDLPLPGDLVVACAVMEELGGLGTQTLVKHGKPSFAVVGEPSNGKLMLGHRGRVELAVHVVGRSAHASMPHRGMNPHYEVARFLTRLSASSMKEDSLFGSSSVAPTLYRTDQTSPNVIPGEVHLTLDWRNVPGETPEQIVRRLNDLLSDCLSPGAEGEVRVATERLTTYTGYSQDFPSIFPSFGLPADHALARAAHRVLVEGLGRQVEMDTWPFATDGGHLMAAGVPTVGFGPGDPTLAHTNQERLSVDALLEGLTGYLSLAIGLGRSDALSG